MNKQEIQKRVDELRPWHFCFNLDGVVTGTSTPDNYEKLDIMTRAGAFARPVYRNVLDLGANSGIVSVWFAEHKQSQVLAVEGAKIFYEQLELVVEVKGYPHSIATLREDLRGLSEDTVGSKAYDCVLLLGVLHHIPEKDRQKLIDLCYSAVNHLGEVYIQTKTDVGALECMEQAGFLFIEEVCDWPRQNRKAWRARKDPMKL